MNEHQNVKYLSIKNDIKTAIQRNELCADEQILSETKLCTKYQVSRITVTRALNDLVNEGYLYRIQGKGTFVKNKQFAERVSHLTGFAKRMKQQQRSLKSQVIEKSSVPIPPRMADYFHLASDQQVILLKRLRIVDQAPLCLSIAYLMPEVFYWVLLEDMEQQSLYDLLENKYHRHLGKALQEFQVGYLNEPDAKLLDITNQDPCLKLTLFAHVDENQPAQYEETYYLGNQYTYQITLNASSEQED